MYTNVWDEESGLEVSENTYARISCYVVDNIIKKHGGIDIKEVNKVVKLNI